MSVTMNVTPAGISALHVAETTYGHDLLARAEVHAKMRGVKEIGILDVLDAADDERKLKEYLRAAVNDLKDCFVARDKGNVLLTVYGGSLEMNALERIREAIK